MFAGNEMFNSLKSHGYSIIELVYNNQANKTSYYHVTKQEGKIDTLKVQYILLKKDNLQSSLSEYMSCTRPDADCSSLFWISPNIYCEIYPGKYNIFHTNYHSKIIIKEENVMESFQTNENITPSKIEEPKVTFENDQEYQIPHRKFSRTPIPEAQKEYKSDEIENNSHSLDDTYSSSSSYTDISTLSSLSSSSSFIWAPTPSFNIFATIETEHALCLDRIRNKN
ncbi:hypothetical protein TBLA_0C00490 [Henningerozyma blattae CBS 6284]|uniref:Uncharacterized protein n=1 Tax=Henningerozyma blattae (strain ATCC 34711 / CBS 6284 / DSM 70876 / NBRC 10599 / NRRL Y-10934 / UCD 77-7) TaxID=1071380 RepID=I2H0G3_HENB6|nr:hypothetical protein TBLA_0C00490 [Tetrapisispora blattae CBS 6284]CCH59865.1 hypothetical protein TBLA_0C00490 [Tetrapisispora blattae CBS 6284]